MRSSLATLLFVASLLQERDKALLEKKCDAALTETADWCRTCDKLAEGGHDGHEIAKTTICIRKTYSNG